MMDRLFLNGNIVMMEGSDHTVFSGMIIRDNKVLSFGSVDYLTGLSPKAEIIDLEGAYVFPTAFCNDASLYTKALETYYPSLKQARDWQQIFDILLAADQNLTQDQWLVATGYDTQNLAEHKPPKRVVLDALFPTRPVMLTALDQNAGVLNTAAIKMIGLASIENAEEEQIYGDDFSSCYRFVIRPNSEALMKVAAKAQTSYLRQGFSTIEEMVLSEQSLAFYRRLSGFDLLDICVSMYPGVSEFDYVNSMFYGNKDKKIYVGGCKLVVDGLPEKNQAYMRAPYTGDRSERGTLLMTEKELMDAIMFAHSRNTSVLAECNGDAACDLVLDCLLKAQEMGRLPKRVALRSPQFLPADRIADVKKVGAIPVFAVQSNYLYGDVMMRQLGVARAAKNNPCALALNNEIPFRIKLDPSCQNVLHAIWCAADRSTKNGVLLGREQAIQPKDAIKALIAGAAKYYEPGIAKGQMLIGNQADFVMLDANPITAKTSDLNKIKILGTYLNGKHVL